MILIRMADGCYRYVSQATLGAWRSWRLAHPAWRPPVRAAASILACGAVGGTMPAAGVAGALRERKAGCVSARTPPPGAAIVA